MNAPELVSFPLPTMTALLCAVLAGLMWRLDLGLRLASVFFACFFGLGAAASFLVALRFGYGNQSLIPIQRTLPVFLGPFLYLGFVSLAVDKDLLFKLAVVHLGVPVALMAIFLGFTDKLQVLDLLISASYAFYCVALYLLWRLGPDAFVNARISISAGISRWLLRSIAFLVFILILDSAIAIDFVTTNGANASTLISYGTMPLIILLIAAVISLPIMFSRNRGAPNQGLAASAEDDELVQRLDDLMNNHHLYLESDITLQRLSRRLTVPTRSLSAAVNRTRGMNLSQYVNQFRLAHAARLLTDTDESVTAISLGSGFMARSNFYREFQRVYKQSPIEYRETTKQISDS